MKDSTIIIIVVAVAAGLFWAVSTGLIKTTGGMINVGGGVIAPQPSANYSGYLSASAAPAISGAINQSISGLGSLFSGWLSSSNPAPKINQTASSTSPSGAAQPAGASLSQVQTAAIEQASGTGAFVAPTTYASYSDTLVGPQIEPVMRYSATSGSAFDYAGLAADNSYDSDYSLGVFA
jgi:hypothetical protein